MPKLPILTGREIMKALSRKGFEVRNQTGSHVQMVGFIDGHEKFAESASPRHK